MSLDVCARRRKIQIAGRNQFLETCMRAPGRSSTSFVSNGSFGRYTGERDRTAGNDRSGLV